MKVKIDEIINKISEIRAFSDDGYLKTTHLVIFLLIGCSDSIKNILEKRAKEIVTDRKTVSFLTVNDTENIVSEVKEALEIVSKSGADLSDLNELHFCPVIVSDKAEIENFSKTMDNLETYCRDSDLRTIWKPFIVLKTDDDSAEKWLREISGKIKQLADNGVANCCRCCVMTRNDEKGFSVSDERLLDTVLFVAFLYANDVTRNGVGRSIAYIREYPEEYFYTAQSVFISNPVVMRTLRCMYMLLDRMDVGKEQEDRDLDLKFVESILEPLYANLPQEGGQVTLVSLYGVMPEADRNAFLNRLKDFARTHYLSQFDFQRNEIFAKFRRGFLRAFIESGKSLEYLQSVIGNDAEINRLSRTPVPVHMSKMPPLSPRSGMPSDISDVFMLMEEQLRKKLNSIGSELIRDFLMSEDFVSLPRLYDDARKLIKNVSEDLSDEAKRRERSGVEIQLQLLGDPDEKIVKNAIKDMTNQSVFSKFIVDISLAMEKDDDHEKAEILAKLLDNLYNAVRGLSGGSGARDYMDLLSDTCTNPTDKAVKECVLKISDQLKYPIRFSNNTKRRRRAFVWGSEDNNFYSAWKQQGVITDVDNEFLPIKSRERFVIMTVSPAFTVNDIRGVRSLKSPSQTALSQPEEKEPPQEFLEE
ncbi:MAG: hypothetical protein LBI27_06940, partial [Clostridiales bacterium]|nr:hypothetical protein [Clostridiales bacterium]